MPAATHWSHPSSRALLAFVASLALGCGSSGVQAQATDAVPDRGATDSVTNVESGATLDAGPDDDAPDALVGEASAGDSFSTTEAAIESGGEADMGATDSATEATSSDSSPASTWGCAENDNLCDCYDAHLTAGYSQPSCTKSYTCCVRFVVDNGMVPSYGGCDCYSDSYLAGVGKTCTDMVDRINGISIYRSATTAPSCPSP